MNFTGKGPWKRCAMLFWHFPGLRAPASPPESTASIAASFLALQRLALWGRPAHKAGRPTACARAQCISGVSPMCGQQDRRARMPTGGSIRGHCVLAYTGLPWGSGWELLPGLPVPKTWIPLGRSLRRLQRTTLPPSQGNASGCCGSDGVLSCVRNRVPSLHLALWASSCPPRRIGTYSDLHKPLGLPIHI